VAASAAPAQTDRDLASISEARTLVRRAQQAQAILGECSQAQIDAMIDAMAAAATAHAEPLARLAVEETGYGVVSDKVQKNLFGSKQVYEFIRPMQTVGVIGRNEATKVVEIAEPFGVVAAIVPSTNPTSTAIYKILISIKARCAVVMSPHPSAARSITRTAEVMYDAGRKAGLPEGAIGWLSVVTLEGTQELMKQRAVAVILATGGMGLVRAAYSAGKPAYGVGPGNAPCYIEQSADLAKAANDILTGKAFDNGVLCSSPNSVVVDQAVEGEVRREFQAQGGYFLSAAEADALGKMLVTPQRLPNPALVGKSATVIAEKLGIAVPPGTRVLLAELKGVGRDHPLSIEKLCPVLSYYIVKDWREGCERCKEILRYGGMGHTMSIHSRNEQVILEFGLHKPAYRICVNTPATLGAIGLTTGLDPAMTLGGGGFGGNITSDNITPRHLLNIKRLAYEIAPAVSRFEQPAGLPARSSAAPRQAAGGITVEALSRRIDDFLGSRGFRSAAPETDRRPRSEAGDQGDEPPAGGSRGDSPPEGQAAGLASEPSPPLEFVCEEDVRRAIRAGRKLVVSERAIVTPSARDLGEEHHVFAAGPSRV